MPQRVIEPVTNLMKGGLVIGGISTPQLINNPQFIDYKWLTVNAFLNITFDLWIMLVALLVSFHTLGLFRLIRWSYRKVRGLAVASD